MAKKFTIFFILMLVFVACSEQKPQTTDKNETNLLDIPISTSETNTTIDENFPPQPVIEREE